MNCSKCGSQNIDGVTFCGSCGAQMESHIPQTQPQYQQYQQQTPPPPPPQYQQQQTYGAGQQGGGYNTQSGATSGYIPLNGGMIPPKNYMVESIIVTVIFFLCCCSPISVILGIIAMVKANKVNDEFARGNTDQAISCSESAKKLSLWAVIAAIIYFVIIYIAYFLYFATIIADAGGWDVFFESFNSSGF